mmetsp:Transcript_10939/g.33546  ORF Transcript_10939/g.33546 Transcript_10939/m.33546 type:complete len:260 (+) Transcript_10939:177-956(+)|eukprot:CAMPEP_0198723298 /NCGR_PEP_ID=MMETSP1475-20131203/828_1 /TAXON_ID= ORGANISM="Unidentified sp., Strain CCMP1999" /NCGR_SAMPLE_ID=MMETSP1475 /ASSEMBLY_ACC=CAM_ASM_001111 /LENGTH=259 /DNA_ID=CAMNT_0044484377 /DNA_START=193 /DNA_END=972 /DNA_ORIENTATION=-
MADELDMSGLFDAPEFEQLDQFEHMFDGGYNEDNMFDNYMDDLGGLDERNTRQEELTAGQNPSKQPSGVAAHSQNFDDIVAESFQPSLEPFGDNDDLGLHLQTTPKASPQVLKRKRSLSQVEENVKRVAMETSAQGGQEPKKDSKLEEIPASVLSDFTVEDVVEKKQTVELSLPEEPRPLRVHLYVVDTQLSPEKVIAELQRAVVSPTAEEVRTQLDNFRTYVLTHQGLDRAETSGRSNMTAQLHKVAYSRRAPLSVAS